MWDLLSELLPSLTELIAFGVDAALIATFVMLHKSTLSSIEALKNAVTVSLDDKLKDVVASHHNQTIPYAVVEGVVQAVNDVIPSRYCKDERGVIQQIVVREHLIRWSNLSRFWSEVSRDITNVTNRVPFYLIPGSGSASGVLSSRASRVGPRILVTETSQAQHLELKNVYDHYTAADTSFVNHFVDWMSGEKRKGIQEIELMLREGTKLLAIGELTYQQGMLKLQPPEGRVYYLGPSISKSVLIKRLQTRLTTYKVTVAVLSAAGIILAAYVGRRAYERYRFKKELREMKSRVDEIRAQRRRELQAAVEAAGSGDSPDADAATQERRDSNGSASRSCVVCLRNEREVVTLECGHLAMCYDCAQSLPTRNCPVCRAVIERIVPTYIC